MLKKLYKVLGIAMTVTLLASLLSVAAPASALSAPSVTLGTGENVISAKAGYTVRFTIDKSLTANSTITITFPEGTIVPAGIINGVTTVGSQGWVGNAYVNSVFTNNTTWNGDATARTMTHTLSGADQAGEGAEIRVVIPNTIITNPPNIGDYTLTVATSAETTPQTSNSYSIVEPTPDKLPGVVTLYNPAGIAINNWTGPTAIVDAINTVSVAGSTIKIGAGYYTEAITVNKTGVTFMPADGLTAADVTVYGTWTVAVTDNVHPTVIDSLTLMPNTASPIINVQAAGNLTTIKNCVITSKTLSGNLINVAGQTVTIDSNTIDTTTKANGAPVADNAINVAAGAVVTINANTITVDAGDCAVNVAGASTPTLTGNTITGSSGTGYQDILAGKTVATITGNTFDALQTAINYDKIGTASSLTVKNNTIKNSTIPTTGAASVMATSTVAAIDISSNTTETVVIQKNMIMDNNGYSLIFGTTAASANASGPTIVGNEFSGNAWGLKNLDVNGTTDVLDVTLNYWGSDTGPTIGGVGTGDAITNATGAVTKYKPWTNTSTNTVVTGQAVAAANDVVDASTTVGITYTADTAQAGISLASYTGNPTMIDTPAAALDGGYYDIYSPNAAGSITLMFFNTNITQDTKVYYFDSLQQAWQYCDVQGVAANSAYVYAKVGATATSLPQPKDLKGTIFALVTQKTIPDAPAASSLTPAIGSSDVSITPVFTWAPVAGAVRYEVTVADEPSFAIPLISNNSDINFFSVSADDALAYDTTYYWRVRAVLADSYAAGTPATAYQVGIFTTEMEPADTTGEGTVVNVEPTKPEVKVEIPPTKITVQPAEAAAIPTYILWIIVVVGAVLIIALIVLIVRTRRA